MSTNQNHRLDTSVLLADEDAFLALKAISGYQPFNPAYSVETLSAKHETMRAAQEAELHAQNALAAARDAAIIAQQAFHDGVLGAKEQVTAQFGSNSDQIASLGLKKKSERKAPVRKSKPAA